jgi:hypothetical protein
VLIVACASESCAASLTVLSSTSGVRCWVDRSLWTAWNPAIFCLQDAIAAFGGMLLSNLNFDFY